MTEDSTPQDDRSVAPRRAVSPRKRAAAFAGFLVLLSTHVGLRAAPDSTDIAPWMPNELALRGVWMLIAWAYLLWLSASLWRDPGGPRPNRCAAASTTSTVTSIRGGSPRDGDDAGGDA